MFGSSQLIFLHIPKTGGKSIRALLHRSLGRVMDLYTPEDVSRFRSMCRDELRQFRAFAGHMPYGLHDYLPGPCRYATFLRDPIDLSVSNYFYILGERSHALNADFQSVSLRDYALGRVAHLDNLQIRHLGDYDFSVYLQGARWERRYADPCSERRRDEALDVLGRCDFVGHYETFGQDVAAMCRRYGLGNQPLPHVNATPIRLRPDQLDEQTHAALRDLNRHDIDFYRRALDMKTARELPAPLRRMARA